MSADVSNQQLRKSREGVELAGHVGGRALTRERVSFLNSVMSRPQLCGRHLPVGHRVHWLADAEARRELRPRIPPGAQGAAVGHAQLRVQGAAEGERAKAEGKKGGGSSGL